MDFRKFKLRDGTELSAPVGVPVTAGGVGKVGYQVFLQDDTRQIHLHMEAVNRFSKLARIPCGARILHPFGGLGMAAQCMEKSIGETYRHEFWERDKDCYEYLKSQEEWFALQVQDSFKTLLERDLRGFGMVYLDPTAMTCKAEHLWEIYARLAASKVEWVWAVDSAISKWWLHTKTYTEYFGRQVASMADYLDAYNAKLNALGYQIVDVSREGTVCYLAIHLQSPSPVPEIVDLRP